MDELTQSMENAVSAMNWGQVYFFMTQFGWTWAPLGRVPTIADLEEEAWRLFDSLVKRKSKTSACGGLVVSKQDGGIEIEFVAVTAYGFPN